jgi:hypothetical protein
MSREQEPFGLPQQHGCSSDVAERTELIYEHRLDSIRSLMARHAEWSAAERFWFIYSHFKVWEEADRSALTDILPLWQQKRKQYQCTVVSSPSPVRSETAGERSAPASQAGTESLSSAKRARMGSPSPARGSTDGPPDVNAKKASDIMEMSSQGAVVNELLDGV